MLNFYFIPKAIDERIHTGRQLGQDSRDGVDLFVFYIILFRIMDVAPHWV